MKELVLISGKGGTGKTSLSAALIALLSKNKNLIAVDCDVDAANLHLVLSPTLIQEELFTSAYCAHIDTAICTRCGLCKELCRFEGIIQTETGNFEVISCEGCGVCYDHCPAGAIRFTEEASGVTRESKTRYGTLFHAQLYPGAENSGKLVSLLKKKARARGKEEGAELILCDGSPGIACPVIASLSGVSAALIISEPSLSGRHDLERVYALCTQFGVPAMLVINKADIYETEADAMAEWAAHHGLPLLSRLPWTTTISAAQRAGMNFIEYLEKDPSHGQEGDREIYRLLKKLRDEVMERLWTP